MLCDGVTSGAESLEADGNEGKQLADGDLKAVGQANAGMRNSDRETPEIEWLQEQQELPDTLLFPKISGTLLTMRPAPHGSQSALILHGPAVIPSLTMRICLQS